MRKFIEILALVFILATSACSQAKKAEVVKQNEAFDYFSAARMN